ncbi:hypothetical protein [Vibrio sp. WXL210]|uniref:hypothetical protein n=1 Tax=Vibrio sp. WXL210 TaxID=3450709 RepID=UPI003EC94F8D
MNEFIVTQYAHFLLFAEYMTDAIPLLIDGKQSLLEVLRHVPSDSIAIMIVSLIVLLVVVKSIVVRTLRLIIGI